MNILPIKVRRGLSHATSIDYVLDKKFVPSEDKIYLVRLNNNSDLGIIKRVHNSDGKSQYKVFALNNEFTKLGGYCFNNSDNLLDFIKSVVASKGMIHEFDDMMDILNNADGLKTLLG